MKGLFACGIEKSFAPLEIRVATTGISNGVYSSENIIETVNRQTSEEVNEDGFYSKWKTLIGR